MSNVTEGTKKPKTNKISTSLAKKQFIVTHRQSVLQETEKHLADPE